MRAPKVEEQRSVDLADPRRWRMLTPEMGGPGRIPAIIWRTAHGIDRLGVSAQHDGVL